MSNTLRDALTHTGHADLPGKTAPTSVQFLRSVDFQIGYAFGADTDVVA